MSRVSPDLPFADICRAARLQRRGREVEVCFLTVGRVCPKAGMMHTISPELKVSLCRARDITC